MNFSITTFFITCVFIVYVNAGQLRYTAKTTDAVAVNSTGIFTAFDGVTTTVTYRNSSTTTGLVILTASVDEYYWLEILPYAPFDTIKYDMFFYLGFINFAGGGANIQLGTFTIPATDPTGKNNCQVFLTCI